VRWQLAIVVPRMLDALAPEELYGTDPYQVRIALARRAGLDQEHLESVEVIEPSTNKRVDGAWWLDRPDGPGVLIGMKGLAYERAIWQSPVHYVVKTRGVGPSTTTVRQRVPAPKTSGAPTGTTPGGVKTTVMRIVTIGHYHLGVDLMAPKGTEVHAVGDATVTFAGREGGFGNLIILEHGRGYQTYYAHLSAIGRGIKPGARVLRGDVIGLVGSTGHSTAPHLHFETRKDGKYIDPFDETHQLEFWVLTADDQERLAMELLAPATETAERRTAETGIAVQANP
jgi:murein DD-endopeptidase MepM/ murein hydrolase activator NlpD